MIAENPDAAYKYTIKANTVAVVSDGSAVLGLGNIGPLAAMPGHGGKSCPLQRIRRRQRLSYLPGHWDTDEIIETVVRIAPAFGGLTWKTFPPRAVLKLRNAWKELLDIPVFRDDQHGTTIVVLAGIINALKVTGKTREGCRVVVNSAGSAAVLPSANFFLPMVFQDVMLCDKAGILARGMDGPELDAGKR